MRFNLKTVIALGGALFMIAPALIAGTFYSDAVHKRAEDVNASRLRMFGETAAGQLGRRMHQLWRDVENMSRTLDLEAPEDIRRQLSFLKNVDSRYSWIGVAKVDGTVLASSLGMLEGQSVAERPWFRRGLNEPTAIDVHDAKLLDKILPAAPEPRRFVDFSAPLKNSSGDVGGVVGAHFDWNWVKNNLSDFTAPGVDVLLVARDQRVLYGPNDLKDTTLTVGSAIAAGQSVSIPLTEQWPDGKNYFTVAIPIQFEDMPSFGWSLIARAEADSSLAPTRALIRWFWTMLGAGFLVTMGLIYLFAMWLSTPMARLANTAEQLANGRTDQPPYDETRYAEASRLSAALVRLQSHSMRPYQPAAVKNDSSEGERPPHIRLVR